MMPFYACLVKEDRLKRNFFRLLRVARMDAEKTTVLLLHIAIDLLAAQIVVIHGC